MNNKWSGKNNCADQLNSVGFGSKHIFPHSSQDECRTGVEFHVSTLHLPHSANRIKRNAVFFILYCPFFFSLPNVCTPEYMYMLRQIMTQVLGLYREHIAGSSIRNLRGLDCRTVRVLESTIRIAVAKVSVLHMFFWKTIIFVIEN